MKLCKSWYGVFGVREKRKITDNIEEAQTSNKYSSWNSYQLDYMAKNYPQKQI